MQAKQAQAQGMSEREAQVAAAKQVEEWRQHMDEQRREMNASAMNDLGAADEERLRRQVEAERDLHVSSLSALAQAGATSVNLSQIAGASWQIHTDGQKRNAARTAGVPLS